MKVLAGRKIKKLQKAVERYGHDPRNHFNLVEALLEADRAGEASDVLDRFSAMAEAAPVRARLDLTRARVSLATGAPREAREILRELLDSLPEGELDREARNLLAQAVVAGLSRDEVAADEAAWAREALLGEAEAGGAGAGEAWEALAALARHEGDAARELRALRKLLRLEPPMEAPGTER